MACVCGGVGYFEQGFLVLLYINKRVVIDHVAMTQRHSLNQRDFGKKIEGLFKHTFEPDIPKDAKLKFFTMNLDACPGVRVDIPAEALEGAIHRLKVRVLGAEIDPTGSSFAGADEAGAGEWD